MPSEVFKMKTGQEKLDEIQKEFEVSCSTKSKEELEILLKNINSMTVVRSDLPKKIKTIIDSLKAIEDKKKKRSLKFLLRPLL